MSTTEIVNPNNPAGSVELFNDDRISLLTRTICKGATPDELQLFIEVANRLRLDPFSRQIFAVKRWDSKERREVMTAQVSIDGFRLVAERSGKYAGQVGPEWCGPDGVWRDVWLSKDAPAAARVAVLRKDWHQPLFAVARWDSYAQRGKEGQLIGLWSKMPDLMLAKVAESLALRKAFPMELSGVYGVEEMGTDPAVIEAEFRASPPREATDTTSAPHGSNGQAVAPPPVGSVKPENEAAIERYKELLSDLDLTDKAKRKAFFAERGLAGVTTDEDLDRALILLEEERDRQEEEEIGDTDLEPDDVLANPNEPDPLSFQAAVSGDPNIDRETGEVHDDPFESLSKEDLQGLRRDVGVAEALAFPGNARSTSSAALRKSMGLPAVETMTSTQLQAYLVVLTRDPYAEPEPETHTSRARKAGQAKAEPTLIDTPPATSQASAAHQAAIRG